MSAHSAKPLRLLQHPGPQLAADERRRSERRPYIIEAWLKAGIESSSEPIEVTGLNISHHGIGCHARQELGAGTFWWMEIGLGPQRLTSEIRIVSCRETENGDFAIGAEFC